MELQHRSGGGAGPGSRKGAFGDVRATLRPSLESATANRPPNRCLASGLARNLRARVSQSCSWPFHWWWSFPQCTTSLEQVHARREVRRGLEPERERLSTSLVMSYAMLGGLVGGSNWIMISRGELGRKLYAYYELGVTGLSISLVDVVLTIASTVAVMAVVLAHLFHPSRGG